jgi:hypothetical protein
MQQQPQQQQQQPQIQIDFTEIQWKNNTNDVQIYRQRMLT